MRRRLSKMMTRLRPNILPITIVMISIATAIGTFAAFIEFGERFVSAARDASFYEMLAFDEQLPSIDGHATIEHVAEERPGPGPGRSGRLIRPLGPCAGRSSPTPDQARLAGEAVIFLLVEHGDDGSHESYYLEIHRGMIGTSHAAEGRIRIDWNDCPRPSSYSLDADRA
jgi:hypothetical protein